jgi:hypothetical protein
MEAVTPALFVVGFVNLLAFPLILWYIKRKLEKFDGKRENARMEQAEAERLARKQRDDERTIVLAIARTMLLDNYEKCMRKGCYTVDEREVYSLLYEAYADDGGNGVIKDLAVRIRELPTEPPSGME